MTNLSRILLMLAPNIAVTLYSLALGEHAGIHLYYFASLAIPFAVVCPSERLMLALGSLCPLTLFVLVWTYGFQSPPWVVISTNYLNAIYLSMMVSTFLSLIAALCYFFQTNKNAEEKLIASIQELREENRIRSQSEHELAKKEAELRSLFDNVKDAVFLIDMDGNCTHANKACSRAFGYSPDEIIGKPIRDFFMRANFCKLEKNIEFSISKPKQIEVNVKSSHGVMKCFSFILSPVVAQDNHIVGTAAVGRDISEEKQIQQQLVVAKENAEKANLAKSSFLAMMGHEIRTPLSVIIGYSDLLLSGLNDPENLQESLTSIRKNGLHLLQLIDDILDISSIESGKLEIRPAPIFLSQEIENAIDQLRSLAAEKGTDIDLTYLSKLPELAETDPLRLRQVIVNLVSNAIKFTSHGKISMIVSTPREHEISILIQDTGIGIEQKSWDQLFKPFSRATEDSQAPKKGTGLGLFLSKKIANLMGGDLVIKSSVPNIGSTFEFTFRINSAKTAKSLGIVNTKKQIKLYFQQEFTILLVEDNLDIQKLYSQYLKSFGCKVIVAGNGYDAIRAAEHQNLSLILMDIQIPLVNGYDAAKAILERKQGMPILAITAHTWKGERQRCLDMGFRDLISKPVTKNHLFNKIEAYLH